MKTAESRTTSRTSFTSVKSPVVDISERRARGIRRANHIANKYIKRSIQESRSLVGFLLYQTNDSPEWRGEGFIQCTSSPTKSFGGIVRALEHFPPNPDELGTPTLSTEDSLDDSETKSNDSTENSPFVEDSSVDRFILKNELAIRSIATSLACDIVTNHFQGMGQQIVVPIR